MTSDSEDSELVAALRADFPSPTSEARLRKRLAAAGLVVSNAVAISSASATAAAAAAPASFSATLVAKISALSWGAKLTLAAVLAAPMLAAPAVLGGDDAPEASPAVVAAKASVAAPAAAALHKPASAAPAPLGAELEASQHSKALPDAPGSGGLAPSRMNEPALSPGARAPAFNEPRFEPRPSVAEFAPEAPAATPRAASTLGEETQLLDRAFAELSAGNRARAQQLIDEHARRFPSGLLRQERERARIRVNEELREE